MPVLRLQLNADERMSCKTYYSLYDFICPDQNMNWLFNRDFSLENVFRDEDASETFEYVRI
jgi:hypothetical protein